MAENEWLSKDFYKVLGVSKDATEDDTSPKRTASWRANTIPT